MVETGTFSTRCEGKHLLRRRKMLPRSLRGGVLRERFQAITLPRHHAYVRLVIDRQVSEPFSATTLTDSEVEGIPREASRKPIED